MLDFKSILESVLQQYGSPVYLLDEEAFVKNYIDFTTTMTNEYPEYQLAYSYKTNHAPKICKLVKELGGYAEVVSDMEYYIAKRLGYENQKIIYNGPTKGPLADEHLLAGGIINIDNLKETEHIIKLASQNQKKNFYVGIRVNTEIGQNFVSRFGMDAEGADLETAVSMLHCAKNVQLVGLHFHVGKARGLKAWKNRTERLIELCDHYIGIPRYVDLGSGMFGQMAPCLAEQFSQSLPSYAEYAAVTARLFAERYGMLPQEKRPILFTEPGATVINRYVSFAAKVKSIKTIKGKQFAVLDCSKYNLGEMCGSKNLPLTVLSMGGLPILCKDLDMTGYTCLENDVVYRNFSGELAPGDYVLFGNVGGYSNVAKPPFILPNCAMVAVQSGGSFDLIKRKEEYEDVFCTYFWE